MSFFVFRRRREKVFGSGAQRPIDGNDRARIMVLAYAARIKGQITRAAVDILRALLYQFANLKDGRCIPGYAALGKAAGCNARTVGRCLPDLEAAGLLTWRNRIWRVRDAAGWLVRRTSNAYDFPLIAKQPIVAVEQGHFVRGTNIQDSNIRERAEKSPLDVALERFEASFAAVSRPM